MKYSFLFVVLGCTALSSLAFAQTIIRDATQQPAAGKASIVVADINFGTGVVGLPALLSKSFRITNRGNAALIISKQSGLVPASLSNVFDISDVTGTSFPLTLDDVNSGFNIRSFSVKFTPDKAGPFDATITFSSNANGIDSVCRLHGMGIMPGLGVNATDFGRRRIKDTYETDAEGNIAQIQVTNTGGVNITITKATATGNLTEFTLPDLSVYNGMTLAPAGQDIQSIGFKPHALRSDTLHITFQNSAGTSCVYEAVGTGVVPRLVMEDVSFDSVDLKNGPKTSTRQFHITNLDINTTPAWAYYDDATIEDVIEVGGGTKIGSGGQTDIGSEGFSFNKAKVDLTLVLPAGLTSNAFDAWYQPTKSGSNSAQLTLVSDAETEPVATWSGKAIGEEIPNAVADESSVLTLHPSPAQDWIEVHTAQPELNGVLVLYNNLGEEVGNYQLINSKIFRLNIAGLDPGFYIVSVSDGTRFVKRTFIKI